MRRRLSATIRRDRTIVAVYSADGTKLLSYTYDAFGNKTTKYLATDMGHGASTNYIGYRGYYYDFDLGLYFTQTRLYDPTTGRFISSDRFDVIAATPDALTDKNLYIYCDNNPVNRVDRGGEFWNYVIGGVIGAVVGGLLGGLTAQKNGQDVFTGILTGAALGTVAGVIAGSGNVAMLSGGVSSVASKATTDIIGATMYGTEFGGWEDYTVAFVFGSINGVVGKSSPIAKNIIDVAARPAANQLIKMGTQGKAFDTEKYVYDVATRAATATGSRSKINTSIGEYNFSVDLGKSFYRATARGIRPVILGR